MEYEEFKSKEDVTSYSSEEEWQHLQEYSVGEEEADSSSSEEELFYGPECPYLFKGKRELSFEERFHVLVTNVNSRKICTKQPLRVQENAAFVIQRSALKDKADWLVTDLGSFSNKGQNGKVVQVENNQVLSSRRWPRRVEERFELDEDEYLVLSTYWKHAKYQDFSRITTVVSQRGGHELDLALVQYQYEGEEHHISPKKHPRSKKPFIPTASSTKKSIKEKVKNPTGPSTIYDKVFEEAGGMMNIKAVSHAPRNIKQVKNARATLKRSTADEDEFYSLLTFANESEGSCVKGLQWTPSPRVVYVEDWQMTEIIENCCEPDSTSVLSIDTTFNVGKFYVTSTTYQNKKFINEQTGKYVNLPGPALFHVRQDQSQFLFFCNTLLEVDYGFENVRFVGGDRDKALKGFLKPLKGVSYLPCKKHVEDNMKAKMQSLQLDTSAKNAILEDVFGRKIPPKRGLVDCNSSEEFETSLTEVSKNWNEQFTVYFQENIADALVTGMAPAIRREIGLKDDFFYNNAAECHNFRYKVKVKEDQAANAIGFPYKSCTWVEGIQSYRRMVRECRNNIQRAFIGQGPFKLASDVKHLEVTEVEWMMKSPEERRRHMARADPFSKQSTASCTPASLACGSNTDEADEGHPDQAEVVIIKETSTSTSSCIADYCSFEDTGLPTHLNGSWNNAMKILDLGGVAEFPGNDTKRAVLSLTSGICHTVQLSSGPYKKPLSCDDQRQGFIRQGICAHTIAVACFNGCLESYLTAYKPRLSTFVRSSIPITTGKKENQKRQRKRKPHELRDVSSNSASEDQDSDTRNEDLEIVFIRDTAACKCYGCSGAVRSKPSEDPPAAPYDIFLRRKEYRVYKQKGTTKICIAKTKEFVYYHPLKACVPKEISRNDIIISAQTRSKLAPTHHEVMWREFGLRL